MTLYSEYLIEIADRKKQGLHPKPIDSGELTEEIISQIVDPENPHREDSLKFLIYNTLPGTTSAAIVKAAFLKNIVLESTTVPEISPAFALEQLSHMKGGPSTKALIDLALGEVLFPADQPPAELLHQLIRVVLHYAVEVDQLPMGVVDDFHFAGGFHKEESSTAAEGLHVSGVRFEER